MAKFTEKERTTLQTEKFLKEFGKIRDSYLLNQLTKTDFLSNAFLK